MPGLSRKLQIKSGSGANLIDVGQAFLLFLDREMNDGDVTATKLGLGQTALA